MAKRNEPELLGQLDQGHLALCGVFRAATRSTPSNRTPNGLAPISCGWGTRNVRKRYSCMTNFAQSLRPAFSEHEISARREVVMRHLCELIKSVGSEKKFEDPEAWLDDLVDRPKHRQSLLQK